MRSLKHWRLSENKLRILRSEKKRTGNELPDNKVVAGGDLKTGPKQFSGQLEGFKSKINKDPNPHGLGDKGMEEVGKSTFPVKAGETPTLSQGIPVGEPKGQFESFKAKKVREEVGVGETGAPALPPQQQKPQGRMYASMNDADGMNVNPMPQEEAPAEDPANPLDPMQNTVQNFAQKMFDKARTLGPQQYKDFIAAVNQMAQMELQNYDRLSTGVTNSLSRSQKGLWGQRV